MRTGRTFNLTLRTAFVDGAHEVPAQVTLQHDGTKPVILVQTEQTTITIALAKLARLAVLHPQLLADDP